LVVENLRKEYAMRGGWLVPGGAKHVAVDNASFAVARGQTVGLIGESGSGKTTIARCVLRLVEPTSGTISLDGVDVTGLSGRRLRQVRRNMQIVFQSPDSSLDPRRSIGASIAEPLRAHGLGTRDTRARRVDELLEQVGLPRSAARERPHSFSGGEKQRIAIARALAISPALIVCDEPASALDVSIQAQILNLLRDVQEEYGLSYLFISHDIATVSVMCDDVLVMKDGRIVESGPVGDVLTAPRDAYTRTLIAAATA
jgi:ABC-type glutathione transport system ATPase component